MRRLLVVEPNGQVALRDLDDGTTRLVREAPADTSPGAAVAEVRSAVWSTAGQWTGYAVDAEDLDGPRQVCVQKSGFEATRVLATELTAFYLCPSPCGRYLSHLSPGPLGLELAVSEVAGGELRVIERGQPLYWAWSADSSQLAVHVEDRLLVVALDVADGAPPLELSRGADRFLAPWWLADGSVVAVADDHIVAYGADGEVRPLAGPVPAGRFTVDAEGRRLAFVDVVQEIPCLIVLDLVSGERTVAATEPVAGFFWSPVGHRLAALVRGGPGELRWLVSDDDRFERLEPFQPGAGWAREVLPFFEQYAHSHAVWSSDATSLVAVGTAGTSAPEAVVQSAQPPFTTERVPRARLAWWAAG